MTTNLTHVCIAELHAQARRDTGPFVNPVHLRTVQRFAPGHREWATAILGRPFPGVRRLTTREITLLALAVHAEPNPPRPQRAPAPSVPARDLTAHEQEWQQLRAHLPVTVTVLHNYTSHRHTGSFVQGAEHAILHEDLNVGRLHRPKDKPLCWTPSRAKNLRDFGYPDDVRRHLTCKECWKVARRIAGTTNKTEEDQ